MVGLQLKPVANVQELRQLCIEQYQRDWFRARQLKAALESLTLWKSISGAYDRAAKDALILPSGKPVFPELSQRSHTASIIDADEA